MDAEDEGHVERESIFEFNKAFVKLEVVFDNYVKEIEK